MDVRLEKNGKFQEIPYFTKGTFSLRENNLLPSSALIPADKEDPADEPVDGHSHPDTEDSHMEHHGQQVAETKPEHPHGDDGEHHGDLHIRRGAQRIRQCKGQRPDRHDTGCMV